MFTDFERELVRLTPDIVFKLRPWLTDRDMSKTLYVLHSKWCQDWL
jgi:hypothetical protein